MAVSLQKGQKVSLTKDRAGLSSLLIGLGWDEAERKRGFFAPKTQDIDCDASAIMLQSGHLSSKDDVVYFGNLSHKSGSVRHFGDNLTGAGEGDDEQILIELNKVPESYDRIVLGNSPSPGRSLAGCITVERTCPSRYTAAIWVEVTATSKGEFQESFTVSFGNGGVPAIRRVPS